jgi:hypothetical protein
MAAPVRATRGPVFDAGGPPSDGDNQGSYPGEITREQSDWLQERAAAHRRRWEEHAAKTKSHALACNQES